MSDRDYYEILGLMPGADSTMVDQAYWHLARKYQCLATTNPHAHHMLDELNEAYGVVGSPRLREQYDAFRDDVLIQKGMIKPVKSRPKRAEKREVRETEEKRLPQVQWPRIRVEHGSTYAVGGVIMALAIAAAWSGVSLLFVVPAVAVGLGLALTPALRRQLPQIELPSFSMPDLSSPRVDVSKLAESNVARLRDLGVGVAKDEPIDAADLHASTAAMISRWRNSIGLRPMAPRESGEGAPSSTLVEIVDGERDLDDGSEPLAAVIDILRGAHRPTNAK